MSENFIPMYDLESLTEPQRQEYLKAVCKHLGVPDNLNLVALTYVDDAEGPARLVPYAMRGATENVRNRLEIDVTSLTNQMIGGSIVFTATATSKVRGRQEVATGSKFIDGLSGAILDDAIMTASTRALRRVTLQFVGAGVLDESEVNQRKTIHVTSTPVVAAPQPTVAPSSEPGKDVTEPKQFVCGTGHPTIEELEKFKQEDFEKEQAKLRADAIAQLNAQKPPKEGVSLQSIAEPVKKTRKPRGPNKKKVDLGPSDIPQHLEPTSHSSAQHVEHVDTMQAIAAQPNADIKPVIQSSTVIAIPVVPVTSERAKADIKAVITPGSQVVEVHQVKPRLTQEQVKPFRQRLFRVVNDYLEPHGFAPKEGIGNADKMRLFAQLMFPEITNMNELSIGQWEKYLYTLEYKIQNEGPAATVKYVEDAIGL